jgi:hypothetical protein
LNLLALEALTDSVIGYGGDKVLIASKAARRQISTASRQVGGDLYEVIDGRHDFEDVEILLVEENAEGNAVLGYDEPAGSWITAAAVAIPAAGGEGGDDHLRQR